MRGHRDDVSGLAISPDGRWLATSSFDNTARVWPLGAGSARVLSGHIIDAAAIGFASGGRRLLNLGAGTARSVPVGRAPGRVLFLPGRHDALLAGVGLLETWDLDHDRRIARAELPIAQSSHRPDEIAISPDGRMIGSQEDGADGETLASVGSDGTVRLWPVTALPDARPSAVPARLVAATTAVIDREGHAWTPGR